jgi:hypothetical protein
MSCLVGAQIHWHVIGALRAISGLPATEEQIFQLCIESFLKWVDEDCILPLLY